MERRVISLVSGGLDSLLATVLMQRQGLEVVPIHLVGPFGCDERAVEVVQRQIGQSVRRVEKGTEFIALVRDPMHGYGRNMNPCIDCRIFMFRRVAPLLDECEAAAIVTGEVIGQRPMSQIRRQMKRIDEACGIADRILRPLSAKRLPPTAIERAGIVDRGKLYDMSGRSRKPQLRLAKEFGITEYASPGGGCKLTAASFVPRLRDFLDHHADDAVEEAHLLSYGRHLRVGDDLKLIVGRNDDENRTLVGYAAVREDSTTPKTAYVPAGFNGPTVLACGKATAEADELAGRVILRYARKQDPAVQGYTIRRIDPEGERIILATDPLPDEELARLRIGTQQGVPMVT